MRDFLRTRQLATINQTYVLVETISLKERLVFFKQDVDLLLKIKHSNHENINPFIGLSYDSTHLYVLWTHCFRGSLAEQIFGKKDERATFENNFRGAFVRDILKVTFAFTLHGFGLYSQLFYRISRCIDNWTLPNRLTLDFEDLHYIAPEIRAELRSHSYSNKSDNLNLTSTIGKAGDMWSFGTILSEILFRRKYVDLEDYYDCKRLSCKQ
ncbi:unnamed protein product [Cylicostephanus goldi]|uniref:Protein kinase domain-containing protein n=1 Tax=Cylicostephanus goldi TaxID=71465 RepID=A0A3P7QBY5_CYLGO|nr:unnamed protein product [Cylicostephanus goldi]